MQKKIWLVQNYSPYHRPEFLVGAPYKGYTKLRRDFIRHFQITNKHNVPNTVQLCGEGQHLAETSNHPCLLKRELQAKLSL